MAINIDNNTDGDVTYQNPPVNRVLFPNITDHATPEEIQAAVDAWLEDHPEATTTVQDGSILPVKLDSSNEAAGGYVLSWNATDEQFEWVNIQADINDLKQDYNNLNKGIADFSMSDFFEGGTITITTGSSGSMLYQNSFGKIRTREGLKLRFYKGNIIGLSDYSEYKFLVGWESDGVTYSSGWKTADYVIVDDSDYVVIIAKQNDGEILDVKNTAILFKGYDNNVIPVIQETEQRVDTLDKYNIVRKTGYITSTGGINAGSGDSWHSQFIPVKQGDVFTVEIYGTSKYAYWCAYVTYDSNYGFLSRTVIVNDAEQRVDANRTFTIGSGVSFIKMTATMISGSLFTLSRNKIAEIPSEFTRLDERIDKLCLLVPNTENGYITSFGVLYPQTAAYEKTTEKIPVIAGDLFVFKQNNDTNNSLWANVNLFNASGVFSTRVSIVNESTAANVDFYYKVTSSGFISFSYRTYNGAVKTEIYSDTNIRIVSAKAVKTENDLMLFNSVINPYIKGIAHRGTTEFVPENTLPAFKYCKENGFKYVETDVVWTSDGVPVLLHDDTINRTARNSDGSEITETISISDITYEQALTYDFGIARSPVFAGTKIPTFEQFISLCRDIGLHPYIEIKNVNGTTEQVQALVQTAKAYGMLRNVTWLNGVDYTSHINAVKSADNDARIGLVVMATNASYMTLINSLRENGHGEVLIECYYSRGGQTDYCTNTDVEFCITNDLPLEVWTVNDKTLLTDMPKYITGIMSDSFNASKAFFENAIS